MATGITTTPPKNVAELLELLQRLGDLPAERVRMQPPPGTATERDVLRALTGPDRRVCELVEGTLVEKPVASIESIYAAELIRLIGNHVRERRLGVVLGEAGFLRLFPGLVRAPDVSYVPWAQVPGRKWPKAPIAAIAPRLAVEVLSKGNTKPEIRRKLKEYFQAGAQLVWVIDPKKQSARVYTEPDEHRVIGKGGALDGGAVLPGFRLSLADLFASSDDPGLADD